MTPNRVAPPPKNGQTLITHASIVNYAHDSTADTAGAPPGSTAGPATRPSTAASAGPRGSPSAFLFPAGTDPTTDPFAALYHRNCIFN